MEDTGAFYEALSEMVGEIIANSHTQINLANQNQRNAICDIIKEVGSALLEIEDEISSRTKRQASKKK